MKMEAGSLQRPQIFEAEGSQVEGAVVSHAAIEEPAVKSKISRPGVYIQKILHQ